jgi:hypothetical protein
VIIVSSGALTTAANALAEKIRRDEGFLSVIDELIKWPNDRVMEVGALIPD